MARIGFLIFFVPLLLFGHCYAQSENDVSGWQLPPLQMLIDSALVHSPLVKLANANVQMGQYELTDAQRDWLKKINISADARYGSMFDYGRISTMTNSGFIMPSIITLNYGAGVSAYLPFSDIFDRKRTIQKAQLKIEQAEIQKDETERGVKQMVVAAYYDVLTVQKTLDTRNEISLSASMLLDQSKSDYAEERISLEEYIKANDTYLSAKNELELQKYALQKAIYTLEIIVGIQLIK